MSARASSRLVVWICAALFLWAGVTVARAVPPFDQVAAWESAKLNPQDSVRLDKQVFFFRQHAAMYEQIAEMREHGVPAPVVCCMHYRESDNDFQKHAHEGSSLLHRTRDEPRGRLPAPAQPPFTFLQSAEDAYYVCDKLQLADWADLQSACDKLESFNGFGYRYKGIPASYLYSGTSLYRGGKYVRDGVFSRTAIDGQLGCVAILKRMIERGVEVPFAQ